MHGGAMQYNTSSDKPLTRIINQSDQSDHSYLGYDGTLRGCRSGMLEIRIAVLSLNCTKEVDKGFRVNHQLVGWTFVRDPSS